MPTLLDTVPVLSEPVDCGSGFCNFILLSLFIAVILENFEVAEAEKMKLQMGQREQKLKKAEEEQRKPKIYFVHRLTWLLGGTKAGKKPGTLCGLGDDVLVDPDDGKLLPGESWYNDDNSLFVLGPANKFRTGARKLADNVIFDGIVLCAIILGTVLLALEGAPKSLPAETLKSFDLINDVSPPTSNASACTVQLHSLWETSDSSSYSTAPSPPPLRAPPQCCWLTRHNCDYQVLFIIFLIEFASKVVGYGFMCELSGLTPGTCVVRSDSSPSV